MTRSFKFSLLFLFRRLVCFFCPHFSPKLQCVKESHVSVDPDGNEASCAEQDHRTCLLLPRWLCSLACHLWLLGGFGFWRWLPSSPTSLALRPGVGGGRAEGERPTSTVIVRLPFSTSCSLHQPWLCVCKQPNLSLHPLFYPVFYVHAGELLRRKENCFQIYLPKYDRYDASMEGLSV